ncbi:hypothetical protein [Verrucomicrobium spinosum]|uniref:hypothetical protein n=1 Tax=Verrucomicrobium spinosum TaxID=2736 RepID=UPI000A65C19E|nr:hypothetical protein [Verrucomicrobium spinosum]
MPLLIAMYRFLLATLLPLIFASCLSPLRAAPDRPNILWVTSEDNSPYLAATEMPWL